MRAATVVSVSHSHRLSSVRWGRVGLFYAIALGWAVLVGAVLFLLGQRDLGAGAGWAASALMIGYMPVPLLAALIVERRDGKGFLLRKIFAKGWWRRLPRIASVTVSVLVALIAVMVIASYLAGNALGISGAGGLLFSADDLVANTLALMGKSMDSTQVAALTAATPNLWGMLGLTLVSAIVAGFTINAVFAFGEEYGWRGWLADQLAGLGPLRANLLIGLMWGLWHAPVILLGYNYGGYGALGVPFMIVWCVAASFLLWRVRQVSGSVLGAAVMHGMINAFAGVFLVILVDRNVLIAAPMGVIGIASIATVAAVFWFVTRRRVIDPIGDADAGEQSTPEPVPAG